MDDKGLIGGLRGRGEEMLTRISNELMANPYFISMVRRSLEAKEVVEDNLRYVLKQMQLPTAEDLAAVHQRLDAIERRLSTLESAAEAPRKPTRKSASKTRKKATKKAKSSKSRAKS